MKGYKTIDDLTKEECERLLQSAKDSKMRKDLQRHLETLEDDAKKKEDTCFVACKSSSDFQGYLARYPEGRYRTDAICKIAELRVVEENDAFKACSSWKDYNKYLTDYPEGRFKVQAEEAMEDRFFVEFCNSKTNCETYLRMYPQGRHVQEAKAKIKKAKRRRALLGLALIFIFYVILLTNA